MTTPDAETKDGPKNDRIRKIAPIAALAILAVLSLFLGIMLLNARADNQELAQTLTDQVIYGQQIRDQLATAQANLTILNQQYQTLQGERDQLTNENQQLQARSSLYQSQNYYLADVLDWFGRQYGYTDPIQLAKAYNEVKGTSLPLNCEPETADRYVRWAAPTSTMFVVTPKKMGWQNAGWSIRENVTFGPDHFDTPGYVGSRGYELRYPLTGSFPLQELHTTINAYETVVPLDFWGEHQAVAIVELNCGVEGTVTVSTDPDETKTIYFVFGGFAINVKLKYFFGDQDQAIAYLTQAANIIIDELFSGF